MSEQPISKDRLAAIRLMEKLGWNVSRQKGRNGGKWQFKRPDTGGLWDLVEVKHADLSVTWAIDIAISFYDAPDLLSDIRALQRQWLARRFSEIWEMLEARDA